MIFFTRGVAFAAFVFLLVGCNSRKTEEAKGTDTGTLTVYTVNYPLKYFADRIGDKHVNVVFPVPPEEDPAFWTPDAETVSAYQQADVILLNGATYAKWISNTTLPDSKLVNTTGAVKDKYIAVKNAPTHSHGQGEEHSHDGIAFTTWLDPEIAIAQASAIRRALIELRPALQSDFDRNFESLKSDLQNLDKRLITAVNKEAKAQPVVFSHPVYQYMERRYGLNATSVLWKPDSLPSDKDWAEFQELHRQHPTKWMIWEGKPLDEIVRRLKELGVESIVFDPCAKMPDEGDWLEVMQQNADALARVYSSQAKNQPDDK